MFGDCFDILRSGSFQTLVYNIERGGLLEEVNYNDDPGAHVVRRHMSSVHRSTME